MCSSLRWFVCYGSACCLHENVLKKLYIYIYKYIYIYTVDIGATFPKTGECRAVKKISRASQANFTALSRFKSKINYNSCN